MTTVTLVHTNGDPGNTNHPRTTSASCAVSTNDREDERHNYDEYVQADVRLDPEGEELPLDRLAELRSARMTSAQEKGLILSKEASSARTKEAQELREHQEDPQALDIPPGLEPLPVKLKLVQNLDKAI